MSDGRVGLNAMTEIEDEGAVAEGRKRRLDAGVERSAPSDQQKRIEIALNGQKRLQARFDPVERQARVAADGIDARLPRIAHSEQAPSRAESR